MTLSRSDGHDLMLQNRSDDLFAGGPREFWLNNCSLERICHRSYPFLSAGICDAGPVACGSCKQQQPVRKTSDTEHITSDIKHMSQDTVETCSKVDPPPESSFTAGSLRQARRKSTSHSVSGEQVQSCEEEVFHRVVDLSNVKIFLSTGKSSQSEKKAWIMSCCRQLPPVLCCMETGNHCWSMTCGS